MAVSKVVYLLWFLSTFVKAQSHDQIIGNLMSFGETELMIFTDSTDISTAINFKRILDPVKIFNINDLWRWSKDAECPMDDYKPFYQRSLPTGYATVVVLVKDVRKLLAVFDQTVLNCTYVFDAGIYNLENRFLFLIDPSESVAEYSEKILTNSINIANHR